MRIFLTVTNRFSMTLTSHVLGMGFVTVINRLSMAVCDDVAVRYRYYVARLTTNGSIASRGEFGSSACAGHTL
jgi:hypothetical protein